MSVYFSAVKNEFLKLLYKKKFTVFLIIQIGVCLIFALIQSIVVRVSDGYLTYGFINMPILLLNIFIQFYIPLVIFMASSDLYATEASDGSLRAALMRPVSRFKVFLSKANAVMLMAVIYMVALFLTATIMQLALGAGMSGFWKSFGSYVLDLIPLMVVVLMAAFLNQLTKSGTLSMLMSIFIYIVLCVVGIFIPQMSGLLFTGYTQWHNLWIGNTIPFGAMAAKVGLLLGYATVFLSSGYYLFDRKDM